MERNFEEIVERVFKEMELKTETLPRIDLYMDQILTLLEETLASEKRQPDERVVTKTMINNYTKERLIMPVKGKKYSREQVMQLLCVLQLKQTLTLGDVKALMGNDRQNEIPFEKVLQEATRLQERLRAQLRGAVHEVWQSCELDGVQRELAVSLALAQTAGDLRRVCERLIDQK